MSPMFAVMFKLFLAIIWAGAIELVLLVSEARFKVRFFPLTIEPLLIRLAVGESIIKPL